MGDWNSTESGGLEKRLRKEADALKMRLDKCAYQKDTEQMIRLYLDLSAKYQILAVKFQKAEDHLYHGVFTLESLTRYNKNGKVEERKIAGDLAIAENALRVAEQISSRDLNPAVYFRIREGIGSEKEIDSLYVHESARAYLAFCDFRRFELEIHRGNRREAEKCLEKASKEASQFLIRNRGFEPYLEGVFSIMGWVRSVTITLGEDLKGYGRTLHLINQADGEKGGQIKERGSIH